LSPQSRRGRAAQPSHRKSSAHGVPTPAQPTPPPAAKPAASGKPGAAATGKPGATARPSGATSKPSATTAKPAAVKAAAAEPVVAAEAATVPSRREGRPVRRKNTLAKARKSPYAKYGGEWVKAYAPLFAVALVAFAALWAWVSFGPHTPTPKDNWNQIESVWKPKRDADIQAVSAAVKAGDFTAEVAAYKSLDTDTKGWMDALGKIASWGDANATPIPGQASTAIQAMSAFTADGQTIAQLLDVVVVAKTPNDILAQKDSLLADEQAFAADYATARTIFAGSAPATSSVPTLAFPAGTYVPPPSANPSDSAGPSPSPSPSATNTPAPTATPSPAPTAS
jgi:hypothetical protein